MLAKLGGDDYLGTMKIKASHATSITTCCYCGARSTLPAKQRIALVCHGCGAAISKIEPLNPMIERAAKSGKHDKPAVPRRAEKPHQHLPKDRPARRKKGKRKKGLWYHVSEAFDDLDDIFDVFD